MTETILYNYFRSSASYRVRIALNLKGIPFEYRAVHLLNQGGEQHQAEYKKLNPSAQVPTLIHNGHTLAQSMAIIDYLDHVQPEPPLFPKDAYERALVVQACEIVNSGIQPVHNLKVLQELGKRFGADQAQRDQWAKDWITQGLDVLEAFLKPHAGKFCMGDRVSAADCFVIPHLANADRYHVSLDTYPTLSRIRVNCNELAAFTKAAPSQQPDAPQTA